MTAACCAAGPTTALIFTPEAAAAHGTNTVQTTRESLELETHAVVQAAAADAAATGRVLLCWQPVRKQGHPEGWAVVTYRDDKVTTNNLPWKTFPDPELLLYKKENSAYRCVFRSDTLKDPRTKDWPAEVLELECLDLNGDGVDEVVVTQGHAGASWTPGCAFVFRLAANRLIPVATLTSHYDINVERGADGEQSVIPITFAIGKTLAHVAQPRWTDYYRFDGQHMVPANSFMMQRFRAWPETLRNVLSDHSDDPELWYYLGVACKILSQGPESERAFSRAQALNYQEPDSESHQAGIYAASDAAPSTSLHTDSFRLPKPGDVVLQTAFDTPAARQAWSKADFAKWAAGDGETTSLCITVPRDQSDGSHMIRLPLNLTRYRGCRLLFECMAKADNVSKPVASYLGVKFMLHYQSATAGPFWQNENDVFGTFDWRRLQFNTRIEPDASDGEISLGLQGSSGTAWFDAIKVTVLRTPLARPAPQTNAPPAFRGHELPRLRGVMSPNVFRDEDLRVLGTEWNANVIRWQITRNWGRAGTDRDLAEYDHWLTGRLDELDKALDSCRRYGIKVVVDMHSPPGGRYPNHDLAIFHEPPYQDHWVAAWEGIARRYKDNPAIWGYDLVNEPVEYTPSPAGVTDYLAAQVRVAKAIRVIDRKTPIFIEAADGDSAAGYNDLEPVDIPNVIYQVHMYLPCEFTHQGVFDKWIPTAYPGKIAGMVWNKQQLRKALQSVREFQLAYNVHIYVGEFSAIRWAPGAVNYLRDCIDLFEEYGWDWSYHAYREWDGWSVEHGSNPQDHQPTQEPTDRKKLLLDWFRKNVKPACDVEAK